MLTVLCGNVQFWGFPRYAKVFTVILALCICIEHEEFGFLVTSFTLPSLWFSPLGYECFLVFTTTYLQILEPFGAQSTTKGLFNLYDLF